MPVKAQYIIRAGVLAFALGVGGAVATTPGVAFAAPTDPSSSRSSSDSSSSSSGSSSSASSSASESAASTSSTIRRRQRIRRPQRLAPRQVRRLGLRVRLTPKPVRPPHQLTLRRQTDALGLRRVRAGRPPARHRRAATPHQPGRRPPKPECPLPSPRLHPRSHRPPRCPPSNQPQRRPASNRPRRHPPQSRCHRRMHKRPQHRKPQSPPRPRLKRMRRAMSRVRHRIPRAATRRTGPDRRVRHRRTGSQRWSSRPPPPPRQRLNRAPRHKRRWSRWPAPFRPWRVLLRRPWRVLLRRKRFLLRRERFQRRSVPRWHRRTSYPASCQMPWHRWV